jgi:hypothetical protein
MAGGGSKDWTSSGTDQMGVVEVVDGRQGTGSIGEGLQWRDDELGGNLGYTVFALKYGHFYIHCPIRRYTRLTPDILYLL